MNNAKIDILEQLLNDRRVKRGDPPSHSYNLGYILSLVGKLEEEIPGLKEAIQLRINSLKEEI